MENVIYEKGAYRIIEVEDLSYDITDLKGDSFNPKYLSDDIKKEAENEFRDELEQKGVFGYILQKWNGKEWIDIDDCHGFIGRYEVDGLDLTSDILSQRIGGKMNAKTWAELLEETLDSLTFNELCELSNEELEIYKAAMESLNREGRGPVCECGAKHTSNPKHHLSYCPLVKRD